MKINIICILTIIVIIISISNSKINILPIVHEHIKTYRDFRNQKIYFLDIVTFILMPIWLAYVFVFVKKITFDSNTSSMLLTVFSIFAALLFNFLMIIIQLKEKNVEEAKLSDKKKVYMMCIEETYYNVSFEILVSIVVIIVLVIKSFLTTEIICVSNIINCVIWILVIIFLLNLIMILKRVFMLYKDVHGKNN